MKKINMTRGKSCVVDDDDYEKVSAYRWHSVRNKNGNWYGKRTTWPERKHMPMQNFIMGVAVGVQVDHINGNSLDNRKVNLRICTHQQNRCNGHKKPRSNTGFKGVYLRRGNRYMSQIKAFGNSIYIGMFDNPVDAAHAYDSKAIEIFGEFASLNFPLTEKVSRSEQ